MAARHYRAGWGTSTIASLGRRMPFESISQFREAFAGRADFAVDTADSYGSGDAERLLARIIPRDNTSPILITKAGYIYSNLPAFLGPTNQILKKIKQRLFGSKRFTPTYLERCLRQSLARLNRPMVSAFLLHDPSHLVIQDPNIWVKLRFLREQGLTEKIGISSSKPDVIAKALEDGEVEVLQTPANLITASDLKSVWKESYKRGVHIVGNHLFPTFLVKQLRMRHIDLARASAALLPPGSTLLCGTHNPIHLREFADWIKEPFCRAQLADCFKRAGLSSDEFNYD